MGCLDDLQVLDLLSGALSAPDVARADEHLDSCESCRDLVASVARAKRAVSVPPELTAGARVGRFVIERRVGAGAMGVVFTARDPELDRLVAIKVVRPELAGDQARARLMREAQAMARVSHPHVVGVFEVGSLGELVFLAMELVEGSSLRTWLLERERPVSERLDVLIQAGRGLAAAHAAGLVHRDFKPDNVLVGRDGRARVTDFGLVALGAEAPATSAPVSDVLCTQTGALLGTPAYMAPEQLERTFADARSDQFAFAVSLFEALFQTRPFAGATVEELLAAIRDAKIAWPRARRVDAALVVALTRALDPDPSKRFPDMAALLHALAPRRSRTRAVVVAAGAVALGVGAAAALLWATRPQAPAACHELPARVDALWTDRQREELTDRFSSVAPSFGAAAATEVGATLDGWVARFRAASEDVCARASSSSGPSEPVLSAQLACLEAGSNEVRTLLQGFGDLDREGVARAAELVSATLPDPGLCSEGDPLRGAPPADAEARELSAKARGALGQSRAWLLLGKLEQAKAEVAQAVELARASQHLPTIGAALLGDAAVLRAEGRSDDALARTREALFALEEGRDDRGVARAWLLMMAIEGARARYDRALEWAGFAGAALARAGDPASLVAELRETLGAIELARGDLVAAERELTKALSLSRDAGDKNPARESRTLTHLGNLARAKGDLAQALSHHQSALSLDQARLGPEHPELGRHWHNLAGVLKAQGKIEQALEAYHRALRIKRASLGREHPDVALTLNSLGIVATERSELANARALFEEAIAIYKKHRHDQQAVVQQNLDALSSAAPAATGSAFKPATPAGARPRAGPPAPPASGGTYMPAPAFP